VLVMKLRRVGYEIEAGYCIGMGVCAAAEGVV
jgi:hypothetical protein